MNGAVVRNNFPMKGLKSADFSAALRVGQDIAMAQYDLSQRALALFVDAGRLNLKLHLKLLGLLISPWARKNR